MLFAYFNYPNSRVSVHGNPACGYIRSHRKEGQRTVKVGVDSLSQELQQFAAEAYRFGASSDTNDMWLEVDCIDPDFNVAVAKLIKQLLSGHYKRFRDAEFSVCECAK